jgi:hypothetical protein
MRFDCAVQACRSWRTQSTPSWGGLTSLQEQEQSMSSMVFEYPRPHRSGALRSINEHPCSSRWRAGANSDTASLLQKLARFLRWTSGAAAVALAVAGCGGGGAGGTVGGNVAPTGTASAQLDPVPAFALAQQSVQAPGTPAPTPAASANMVANASFESGMTDWFDWANSSVVSGQASSGTSALRVGPAAGGAGQVVAGIVPGNVYRLTAQARVSAASETVYVGINFVDSSGATPTLNPFTQNSVLVSSTSYTTASVDVVPPPNAVTALVYVWKNAGSGVADVDDFSLQSLGPATPRAPSSVNKVANGGFEFPLAAGWFNFANATITSTPNAAAGYSALQVGTGPGGVGQSVGGITAGTTYRMSASAKVSDPSETGYFGLMFTDDAGNGLLAQNVVFRSTTYQKLQADVTAPAGATKAVVFVWKNAGDGYAFVDDASLVHVAPVSTSFTPVSGSPTVLANAATTGRGVAVLRNGARVAAWSDDSGVHSQSVDAQGRLVGSAMAIASPGTFDGVAALAGGGYAVQYDQPGAVLVQLFDATGAPAGAPVAIRTQAQVAADPRYVLRDQARLAGGAGVYPVPDGGFIAAYTESHNPGNPYDFPIVTFARRYDALASPMGAPSIVGDDTTVSLAPTPAGGLIAGSVYACGCGASGRADFVVYDANLQSLGPTPNESTPGSYNSTPNGAGLANGNFVAIWTLGSQVHGELFGPAPSGGFVDLTPRSPGPATTFNFTFANAGAGARVTALAGGGFLLSWGTSAQAFGANGFPVSEVVQILDGSIAATPEGGFVVVAQVGSQLVEQEYAAGH